MTILHVESFSVNKNPDTSAEFERDNYTQMVGYYILPSQLFSTFVKGAADNVDLNIELDKALRAVEASSADSESADDFKGLFQDFDVNSNKLGGTTVERSKRLATIMMAVDKLDLGSFTDTDIDVFGDAYEYLLRMYATNAGRSGGEHFTPQEVSEVVATIAADNRPTVRRAYDPCAGSGSLLFRFAKVLGIDNITDGLYGQEINPTNHALARMNMFLHGVPFEKFDIKRGDTLENPLHLEVQPFDAIVSNPPYSQKWPGKDDVTLINDPRFAPAGALAPKGYSDLAFTMHMLHHLEEDGVAAIVEFPGILYRAGTEKTIRQYLVDNNFVDAIIQLPPNLFFSTGISTVILVLKKNRESNDVLFIDASKHFVKNGNSNTLTSTNQQSILALYFNRQDVEYQAKLVPTADIAAKDYALSVNSYVEKEDTREKVDIAQLNADIARVCTEQEALRAQVNEIVAALDGEGV